MNEIDRGRKQAMSAGGLARAGSSRRDDVMARCVEHRRLLALLQHLRSARRVAEPVTHIIKTIAAGQALPHFTPQMLDEMNAQHAKEFAGCTKPETIALHKKGAAAAAAAVRGLSDAELAKTGTVFTGIPPMSAEEMVKRALLGHVDEHLGSIRTTIGS